LDVRHDERELVPPGATGAVEPALGRRRGAYDRTAEQVEGHHSDDDQRQRRQAGAGGQHSRERRTGERGGGGDEELTTARLRRDELVVEPSQDVRWSHHGLRVFVPHVRVGSR
jgi:hypothetical protein